jgi:hypothetical protein
MSWQLAEQIHEPFNENRSEPMPTLTITAVNAATDTITITAHGLNTGDGFLAIYTAAGTYPGGLAPVTDYWAIKVDANNVKLATSSTLALAGTAIDITSTGSGTLLLLQGLPYRVPRVTAAGSQVFSADFNAAWAAQVALWNLLTGQAQSVYSGITLATINEAALAPLMQFRDWKSQSRSTIDHLGYRGGNVSEWEEHWRVAAGTTAPAGWTFTVNSGSAVTVTDPTSNLGQRYVTLTTTTGLIGDNASCAPEYVGWMDNSSVIAEEFTFLTWTFNTSGLSSSRCGIQFSGNSGNDFAVVGAVAGTANLQAYTIVNGVASAADTGVAVVAGAKYRVRIECLGSSNTSQAAGTFQFRFYINGVLVATKNQATIVAAKFRPYFRIVTTASGLADQIFIGRVRVCFNHAPASDAI